MKRVLFYQLRHALWLLIWYLMVNSGCPSGMSITSKTRPSLFASALSAQFISISSHYHLIIGRFCFQVLWLTSDKNKTSSNSWLADFRSVPAFPPILRSRQYISLSILHIKASCIFFSQACKLPAVKCSFFKANSESNRYPYSREYKILSTLQGTDYFQSPYLQFTPLSPPILL